MFCRAGLYVGMGGAIASSSLSGSASAGVYSDPRYYFGGSQAVSCSDAGPSAANAACSASSYFYATDGSPASINVAVSGLAEASDGHIGFNGRLFTSYYGGAYPDSCCTGSQLMGGSSAAYSFPISFGDLEPSFILLTFEAVDNAVSDAGGATFFQNYSVTLGSDSPWLFSMNGMSPTEFTETFLVDPTAGSTLLSVQGTNRGDLYNEDIGFILESATLDITRIEFLDANGDPIPEPSALCLCGAGLVVLAGFRGHRRSR